MIITKKHLSRRTFLRGTFGAAVALPLLDAMVPALTAQSRTAASSPFRFGAVYLPSGVFPDTWHPDAAGSDFAFKPVMQPLEPFRDQLVTVSKMKAPWGESVHLGASSAFLNGVGPVGRRDGHRRRLRQDRVEEDRRPVHRRQGGRRYAAALDRSRHRGHGHRGRAPATASPARSSTRSSWRDDTSPLPVGINPRVTFERMFGETGSTEQRVGAPEGEAEPARLGDAGNREAAAARSARPTAPSSTSTSATSATSSSSSIAWKAGSAPSPAIPKRPIGLPEAFDDHMTVTYNLMHLAFQGDISRVFTFMIGHEAERPRLRAHRHPRDAPQHLAPRQRRRRSWPSTPRSAPTRSSSSPSSSRS